MDDADKASRQEEMLEKAALTHRKPVENHYGRCLYCGDPSVFRYCCDGCEEDDKRFETQEMINGKSRARL